jgi:hypothetical protein
MTEGQQARQRGRQHVMLGSWAARAGVSMAKQVSGASTAAMQQNFVTSNVTPFKFQL